MIQFASCVGLLKYYLQSVEHPHKEIAGVRCISGTMSNQDQGMFIHIEVV